MAPKSARLRYRSKTLPHELITFDDYSCASPVGAIPITTRAIPFIDFGRHTSSIEMESHNRQFVERRHDRLKAVLPVKVIGKDASGNCFEDLAHTLDITPGGGRLGAMHHELKVSDQLTVQYRQYRMEFRVVWTKLLDKAREYQVGLQMIEKEKVAWGLANNEQAAVHTDVPRLRAFATSGAA